MSKKMPSRRRAQTVALPSARARAEVHRGDCLPIVRALAAGSVDMIYVDPPFFTQRRHRLLARDRKTRYEFSDVWPSQADYLRFLRERLLALRRALRDTGSLFFHCDSHAAHHVRCLLDEVFGASMFRAEIIWAYRRWSNSRRGPLPSHQTIYFYSKTDDYFYDQLYGDYSPATNVDQILQQRQRDRFGKAVYRRDADGEVVHDGHKKGVPLGDVWDIPLLNPKAKERTGYPTQKPILLLERLIHLATRPGDVVLDPFCGSGTTLVAAQLLDRHAIGIDIADQAVRLTRRRLRQPTRTSSELLRKGRAAYLQQDGEALAHLGGLPIVPVQRNRGIDALLVGTPGHRPVLVRVQRADETIAQAARLLLRAGKKKQPASLVLLVTDADRCGGPNEPMPSGILAVPSVACALRELGIPLNAGAVDARRGERTRLS
jgi:site-specific DNA-methyltransferase (adenine-specific)